MDYKGKEGPVADMLLEKGFPHDVRAKLADSYGAVLTSLAQRLSPAGGYRPLVEGLEGHPDKRLVADVGRALLAVDPTAAFAAAKYAGDNKLEIEARERRIKEVSEGRISASVAYVYAISKEAYGDRATANTIARIRSTRDPKSMVQDALSYDLSPETIDIVAQAALRDHPIDAYRLALKAGNDDIAQRALDRSFKKDPNHLFYFATNDPVREEIADKVLAESLDQVDPLRVYWYAVDRKKSDLIGKAREKFARENPEGAYKNADSDPTLRKLAIDNLSPKQVDKLIKEGKRDPALIAASEKNANVASLNAAEIDNLFG